MIGNIHDVNYMKLATDNGITDPNHVIPGQRIKIEKVYLEKIVIPDF